MIVYANHFPLSATLAASGTWLLMGARASGLATMTSTGLTTKTATVSALLGMTDARKALSGTTKTASASACPHIAPLGRTGIQQLASASAN